MTVSVRREPLSSPIARALISALNDELSRQYSEAGATHFYLDTEEVSDMRECIRRARQSGASALTLHTTDMMPVAMHLYEGMGFVRAPELDLSPLPGVVKSGRGIRLEDLRR